METITTRSEQVQELMEIMAREVLTMMDETGCTLEQAMDAAARWVYNKYPHVAAAIMVEVAS